MIAVLYLRKYASPKEGPSGCFTFDSLESESYLKCALSCLRNSKFTYGQERLYHLSSSYFHNSAAMRDNALWMGLNSGLYRQKSEDFDCKRFPSAHFLALEKTFRESCRQTPDSHAFSCLAMGRCTVYAVHRQAVSHEASAEDPGGRIADALPSIALDDHKIARYIKSRKVHTRTVYAATILNY